MSKNLRNFVQAVHAFDAVVRRTTDSDWGNATPCDGWSARDLLEHQSAVLNGVAAVAESGAMAPPTPPADMSNPHVAWSLTRDGLMEALDRQGVLQQQGPFWFDAPTVDDMVGIVMWDVVAHTWDLAQAVGQDHCLDDSLAQACYDVVAPMSEMLVKTGRTSEPLPVAADAPILHRYLALVGRQA